MFLRKRLDFLKSTQNGDGGWGYFPGKSSWLEPTAYAMLALYGDAGAADGWERAWKLIQGWQLPEGAWRPAAHVWEPHWSTALAITLLSVRRVRGTALTQGVSWLLQIEGAEGGWLRRLFRFCFPRAMPINPGLLGWPWRPGNTSWVEPTAHTLVALKRVAPYAGGGVLLSRVRDAEAMIWDRRCHDGGWNFGSPSVYGNDLPSYAESTGLALLGLQGQAKGKLDGALDVAARQRVQTRSEVAKVWLDIALRVHGRPVLADTARLDDQAVPRDTLLAALQALACPDGNYRLLTPGDQA